MDDDLRRVLVIAYACEPNVGSEPAIGWNTAIGLCNRFEVWVLTGSNNRSAIEAALAMEPVRRLHVAYFDLPRWLAFWKRRQRGVQLYYYLWQLLAARVVRRIVAEHEIDVVHHATFVKYWAPSAGRVSKVPFVLGPVGGGERLPSSLWATQSIRSLLYEVARLVAQRLGELDPAVRRTARCATIAVATTQDTAQRLSRLGCDKVRVMSQCSLAHEDMRELARIERVTHDGAIRFLAVGRLIGLKGYELLLRALACAQIERPWEIAFVGDGPQRARLESIARAFGLSDRVRFLGWLERKRVFEEYARADVFVHPSLHDSGGQAVLEAMATGLPVVGLRTGGTAMLVADGAGVLVEPCGPEATIEQLGFACKRLAEDDAYRTSCGVRARDVALSDFSSDAYSAKLAQLLLEALETAPPNPGGQQET